VDEVNRTYVLSVDGKRMAVTRFTATGQIDGGWATGGTYVVQSFTLPTVQDVPKAMALDPVNHELYVAGSSNGNWAITQIHVNTLATLPQGWIATPFAGTADGLWLDSSDDFDELGVAGTTSSGTIQVAVLLPFGSGTQNPGALANNYANGAGFVAVPNSAYGITGTAPVVSATASALFETDDPEVPGGGIGEAEFFVSGTVSYCNAGTTNNISGSDMVVINIKEAGNGLRAGWGNGNGVALFNSTCSACRVGPNLDSNYALVGSVVNDTSYVTLVGTNGTSVLTERFKRTNGQADTAAYGLLDGVGPLHKGYAVGPAGAGYAAVLDPLPVNKIVISGTGGSNDFLAVRLNDNGTLDTTFGQSGSIRIDFGSTSGIVTDGGKSIALRTFHNADGTTTFDFLVAGYTFDAATSKYRIALVDLLEDHSFHVT
jgi:hypothetical protein